jgi:type IV pilus assembly protein PilB
MMEQTDHITLSTELQQLLTPEQAWRYLIVPKDASPTASEFYAAESSITDDLAEELEILFGKSVSLEVLEETLLKNTLAKYYRKTASSAKQVSVGASQAEDFLGDLIIEARDYGSSDIHIETYEEKARVRIRIDGMLVERYSFGKADYPSLINKIKIRANLDISEKRLPQDGRIHFNQEGYKMDIRVSILPTLYGEKIVMRLLNNDATDVHLDQLGFSQREHEDYLEGIRKPSGILLISGPTGSGKTTTLYATLKLLNQEKFNIVTVEDPVEYTLEGINQVQLRESIGLTFSSALRTFLRQDPDIIMLGEIRDEETAQMAIRAALTGHLVLSTIHTNSAWGTVSRLIDMGVPPFLLASTINTSVAQRLVKKLCSSCKEQQAFDPKLYPKSFTPINQVQQHFIAKGCEACHFTGYKGRTAVYEVIPMDHDLVQAIKSEQLNVDDHLISKGYNSLSHNAFQLFENGETSLDEIYPLLLQTR